MLDDTRSRPPGWRPLAAVAVTLVLWASAFVGIRHLGETVPPGSLSLARLLIMAVTLAVFLVRRPTRWPARGEWPLILIGGTAWFGAYNLALNESERRIDAGTAALIVQIGPILVAFLAALFCGERLTRWLLIGIAVGFGGVLVIAQASAASSQGDPTGVALAAVAAFTFAVGVIAQKKLVVSMSALETTFWCCAAGAVVCLPWAGELVGVVGEASADTVWWLIYLGVFPSAIAFTLWAYALTHTNAGAMALTTFLVPFITTVMAWLLLDEVPPALAFAGGALCIVGVLLTRKKSPTPVLRQPV